MKAAAGCLLDTSVVSLGQMQKVTYQSNKAARQHEAKHIITVPQKHSDNRKEKEKMIKSTVCCPQEKGSAVEKKPHSAFQQ